MERKKKEVKLRKKPATNQNKYILNLLLILFILVIVFFLIVILSNQKQKEAAKTSPKLEPKTLSELQTQACNIADQAGTCNSRLADVGIVLKEDCCEVLGKCC